MIAKRREPSGQMSKTSCERPTVVVRFREGVRLSDREDLGDQIEQMGIGPWKKLVQDFPGLTLGPVFTHLTRDDLQKLSRRATETDPTYKPADVGAFFYLHGPPETDLVALVKTLLCWNSVQEAYIDHAGPDPVVNAADDPRSANQGYLDPAPDGIDAEYAWTFVGGDGAGQRFIDVERGWTSDHEDILAQGATLLHGTLLDTYTTLSGRAILNRDPANPDFRDSGAIIVTAATSTAPHTRLAYGPHGRRIDCHAWGENINTLSSDAAGATTAYGATFGGTSGASPIITGAALAVQGRAEVQLGVRFSPRQMRTILSDPATGTPPDATETTPISVMPNLRGIFETVFNTAADVYIRDFVGDAGEPHMGAVSASPHIILRPTAVANPQAAFGTGSGTENNATLGSQADSGQDNVIYVRVLNQGGSPATSVEATVFWSPVATLVTPDLWTLVGTTILPHVPIGEQLTVSDAIVWQQANIPGAGHYCFVGLVGNAADPAPGPADFMNWDNVRRVMRENNNVTWRNVNVEDNDPDVDEPMVPKSVKPLAVLAPGAPDKARYMALEFMGNLPEGAKAMVEVPLGLYELLHERHQLGKVSIDRKRTVALIPVNPHGRMRFGEVLFPARSRPALRLLVQMPERRRQETYQIAVRQMWEREEVGRVTWQLRRQQRANE